jgi:CRISPR-associated endonuclease/helicase Cas3
MDYIAHVRENGDRQSLREHLLGVGEKSSSNAAKIGLAKQGELIGLLHDLGKYSAAFQAYLASAAGILNQDEDEDFVDAEKLKGKIDHSTAGAQLVWRELEKRGPLGQIVGQILALCIASHHSGLIDCLSSDRQSLGEDIFTRRMQKADVRIHLVEAWAKADGPIRDRVESLFATPEVMTELQAWLARVALAAPGKTDKGFVAQQQIGLLVRFMFSCLIDGDRLDTAIFEKPRANRHRPQGEYADWPLLISRLEAHLAALEPREPIDHLRRDISHHCLVGAARERGIFTLSVPTGGGKTLASLRFALHHAARHTNPVQGKKIDRIIYVIPFVHHRSER